MGVGWMREFETLLLLVSLALVAGCSTVTIEGGGGEDVVFSKPITVHGSMYGFTWDGSDDVVLAQDGNKRLRPIYSVRAHTNYFYLLTGVVSLGLYYPQTFEYKLVAPEKIDGDGEKPYNPFKKKKRGDE